MLVAARVGGPKLGCQAVAARVARTLGEGWQPARSGQIDMLQAEVTALKTLVITSTPASPNRELHPQLLSPTKAGPRKGHFRHKSTSSTLCPAVCPAAGHILVPDKEGREVRGGGRRADTGRRDGPLSALQWGPAGSRHAPPGLRDPETVLSPRGQRWP